MKNLRFAVYEVGSDLTHQRGKRQNILKGVALLVTFACRMALGLLSGARFLTVALEGLFGSTSFLSVHTGMHINNLLLFHRGTN